MPKRAADGFAPSSAAHRREQYDEEPIDVAAAGAMGGDAVITRETVKQYIAKLQPDEAEAFLYVAIDGMTQLEVAEVMGISRRTVQRLMDKVEAKLAVVRRHEPR